MCVGLELPLQTSPVTTCHSCSIISLIVFSLSKSISFFDRKCFLYLKYSSGFILFLRFIFFLLLQYDNYHDKFLLQIALHKIPLFHLISWCETFVETYSFRRVSGDCAFLQNFNTKRLGEISVVYAVLWQ